MKYFPDKKEITLEKELSDLDSLVIAFLNIIKKHVDYVIISGYVSILLGRSRATEDIDLFFKKMEKNTFDAIYRDLEKNDFWCVNTSEMNEAWDYLNKGLAIRFAIKDTAIPNFEVKFPKRRIDEETFLDFINVKTEKGVIKISSLERQIAFKRYYLGSDKDEEDALYIEEAFKGQIDYDKVNKLKKVIMGIKREENGN